MNEPSSPSDETLSWDRRDGESERAYQSFAAYRDLGPRRSLDKAFALLAGGEQRQNSAKTAPRHWDDWARDFAWGERARAYDAHQERASRAAKEAEHHRQLTEFRDRQRRLNAAASEASIRLLRIANKRLEALEKADAKLDVPASALPAFIRAAAAVGAAATAGEAEALAVDELLRHLDEESDAGARPG